MKKEKKKRNFIFNYKMDKKKSMLYMEKRHSK